MSVSHLVLYVLVTELQLHDVLEGPEQRLIKVEVWKLRPARQHLRQNVVDERNGLLGYVALLVARSLRGGGNSVQSIFIIFFTYNILSTPIPQ